MTISNLLYLSLMLASFILSLIANGREYHLHTLRILLGFSIITETIVYTMYYGLHLMKGYNMIYHIYIPIEYVLFSYYFSRNINYAGINKIFISMSLLFILTSAFVSFKINPINFPGINLNLEGAIIVVWASISLLSIQPSGEHSIFALPVFWVSAGALIYFSGGFFFNFVYQYFIENQSEFARLLNSLINKGLNYILYLSCKSSA